MTQDNTSTGSQKPAIPSDLALQPAAYRYWKDKFACWEYSDVHLSFPSVPAGTPMYSLFTQEQVGHLQAQILSLRAELAALKSAAAATASEDAEASHAPAALPYGSTDFGFTYAHLDLAEGDKRLLSFITHMLGNDHVAFSDLEQLVQAARLHGRAPVQPAREPQKSGAYGIYGTYLDQIDAEQAGDEWLRSLVPTDRHAAFWQYERFSFSPHDGRVMLIRHKERPVAAALIVRDGLNRSQLLRWQASVLPGDSAR